jgi:membrane protein DedA with SNARE-associated domain
MLGSVTGSIVHLHVPGLAGMSRVRYRAFLAYNVAGGTVWGRGLCSWGTWRAPATRSAGVRH